jgi:uncharacterized protein YjiS (DUF1127 family)
MLVIHCPENLGRSTHHLGAFTRLFVRLEAWLEERATARTLYTMDDRALADLAISRSDVERINHRARLPIWWRLAERRPCP